MSIINLLIPGALQVLWPFMCLYGMASGWLVQHLLLDLQLYFGMWILFGVLYNLYVKVHNPEQRINPLLVGALGMWFIADSFLITLVALCTFDVGEWGTRGVASVGSIAPTVQAPHTVEPGEASTCELEEA